MSDPSVSVTPRCTATNNRGQPCRAYPVHGATVCRAHGGAAPQVRAKAEQRILAAADPAAAKLVQLMGDKRVPPQVQLAAARDLLDRAGLTKTSQVEVALRPFEVDILGLLVDVPDDAPSVVNGQVLAERPDPAALPRSNQGRRIGRERPGP